MHEEKGATTMAQSGSRRVDAAAIAWAAGYFDAGGNTTISGTSLKLQVNRSAPPGLPPPPELRRFAEVVGNGRISRPYQEAGADGYPRKPRYQRYAYREDAIAVLEFLWPFLGPSKREQANLQLGKQGLPPIK